MRQFVLGLVLVLGGSFAGCRKEVAAAPNERQQPLILAVPTNGKYTGAFIDFGDTEDNVTLDGIEDFETMVGKHQAIIASSSYWGEQRFPTRNLEIISRHGSMPLVFWSPWDKPYLQNRGPDRFSLREIIKGTWDTYIDRWADSARAFGKPMLVSFANEMNGEWFPWSGWFYGANKPVPGQPNEWQGPETFKKAYRHVVDRVRARGAKNIQWVFHTNNYAEPNETWNYPAAYYPGSNYVDWLGMSIYGQQVGGDDWSPVEPLITWPYDQMCAVDPTKPIMVAEWGVGEFPRHGDKAKFISEGLQLLRTQYPRIKAAVYWSERWQNDDNTYSNLRVNSSVEALAAYKKGIANPAWLGRPLFKPQK
ncbi:MAG TPA: glycosyl hydrolase [Chthoniobacterales bacterium]|jgi:beta-mannanase